MARFDLFIDQFKSELTGNKNEPSQSSEHQVKSSSCLSCSVPVKHSDIEVMHKFNIKRTRWSQFVAIFLIVFNAGDNWNKVQVGKKYKVR